jgi:glycosyltransferase involved in cell wall biosynthesis
MRIEFCLPAHNEEKIISESILSLLAYCNRQDYDFDWAIIIIDNGSRDNTLAISSKLAGGKIKVYAIGDCGKGVAIKKYALTSSADIMLYMDVDLAVSLNNIEDVLNPILNDHYDLVFGSRLLPESKTSRSFTRELSSQIYNFLAKIILRQNFSDLQCGFKAIRLGVFKKLLPHIKDNKWFFDTELIVMANFFKYRIKEVPVEWEENRWDQRKSKIKVFRDSLTFFKNLILLKAYLTKLDKKT